MVKNTVKFTPTLITILTSFVIQLTKLGLEHGQGGNRLLWQINRGNLETIMRNNTIKIGLSILWVAAALSFFRSALEAQEPPAARPDPQATLRVAVVGDTGIGERAFHWGFLAVQRAMESEKPDVLLHLGDFVYQPEFMPDRCDEKYIEEIKATLVQPFPMRLFVAGDNDLPPHRRKPKASGCWEHIDPLDSPFDTRVAWGPQPRAFEGTKVIGNTLFAVLNNQPWQDPTPWLEPEIKRARQEGLWVVVAVHEPALTTAWYLEKRATVLRQINALGPDLVLSGNQHSYERFHALGVPDEDGVFSVHASPTGEYPQGTGTVHVVSGGGGALIKPFADQQGIAERTAPKAVFDALAARALMNHYLILEMTPRTLTGKTFRVCPGEAQEGKKNPRWRARKKMWNSISLRCDGKPVGVTRFDQFTIVR